MALASLAVAEVRIGSRQKGPATCFARSRLAPAAADRDGLPPLCPGTALDKRTPPA